jgi:hypothetical protein
VQLRAPCALVVQRVENAALDPARRGRFPIKKTSAVILSTLDLGKARRILPTHKTPRFARSDGFGVRFFGPFGASE